MAKKDNLALFGGAPAIMLDQTEASRWPVVEREELDAVAEVTAGGAWSSNMVANRLEEQFADYIGVNYALAHNNGTSALHSCAFALGLGPGDEVIAPATSYWATVMPILSVGAIPVFADVEPVFLNLDPQDAERKITPRTKAIVLCHWGGMPCDMDSFADIARRHGLNLIEDASHAHGATYRGRRIGSFGDVAGFSMQTSKLMPAGEGGIFVTDEREYRDRAVLLGHYERVRELEGEEGRRLQHTGYGFKYRISPLNAALGEVALSKLDERNAKRSGGIHYLYGQLSEVPGIVPPSIPAYIEAVHYLPFVMYEPERLGGLPVDLFVKALKAEGAAIEGGTMLRHSGGLHAQPMFTERLHRAFEHPANAESVGRVRYGPGTLPVTDNPPGDRITLPQLPRPTEALLDQYVEAFRKVAVNADALI
jgi:dTDP-4-amino-4,6-dideoxygalactose transaminase